MNVYQVAAVFLIGIAGGVVWAWILAAIDRRWGK